MSRSDLLDWLQPQFEALATETGQDQTDSQTGYGPAIDTALRTLGTSQADLAAATVETGSEYAAQVLAAFYAVQRFWRALSIRADITLDGGQVVKKRSQLFAQVKLLLDDLRGDMESLGFGNPQYQIGTLTLDYLEPRSEF